MGRLFRHPAFWAVCFLAWMAWLWWLSSGPIDYPQTLQFNNFDKVLHAGFFMGGSGLLSAFLYRRSPLPDTDASGWRRRILTAVLVVGMVGALDEFHQSFVPNRSGNDPFDLSADITGALIGALVFRRMRGILRDPA
jgi:VanZ family protein